MTKSSPITTLTSNGTEVRIGRRQPLVMIGERINPTNRATLERALRSGDLSLVIEDARAQTAAGAQVLDVNVGLPSIDEAALMASVVQVLQSSIEAPLCLDSGNFEALKAGLQAYEGKPLVNSVTGEQESLSQVLPLVLEHGAAVIALLMDDDGITMEPEKRLAIAERILNRAQREGIAAEDVVIDPLVLAVGADTQSSRVTLETIRLVRERLGLNMTLGSSNVSHGLPGREALNATFVAMAVAGGVTCPIVNPLQSAMRETVLAADLLLGRDEWAMQWIKHWRAKSTS